MWLESVQQFTCRLFGARNFLLPTVCTHSYSINDIVYALVAISFIVVQKASEPGLAQIT